MIEVRNCQKIWGIPAVDILIFPPAEDDLFGALLMYTC
jgi:hypothetical protein